MADYSISTAGKIADKIGIQNIIDILNDKWSHLIDEELRAQFSPDTYNGLAWLKTQEMNILKRVVNELSIIYKRPPKRYVYTESEEKDEQGDIDVIKVDDEAYDEAVDETYKNVVLKAVNRHTNAENHVVLKVAFRNKRIEYDILLFNNVEVYTAEDDWNRITAVKYYVGLKLPQAYGRAQSSEPQKNTFSQPSLKDALVSGGRKTQDYTEAFVWVAEDIQNDGIICSPDISTLQGGQVYKVRPGFESEVVVSQEEIPYRNADGSPVLPFVIFDRKWPVDQRFNFDQGNDLFDLNMNVAIMLVLINQMMKYQSFKQPVILTPDRKQVPNPLRMDPAAVLVMETKANSETSVSTLDLETNVTAFYEIINKRILAVLSGYGISPDNFTMSATPSSGFALKISNIGKIEAREDQLDLYRMAEKSLFEIERKVWNTWAPSIGKPIIDEKAEFAIDFAEVEFPKSPAEYVAEKTFLIAHNVETDLDLIREYNPDIDDSLATKILKDNKALNSRQQVTALQPLGNRPV